MDFLAASQNVDNNTTDKIPCYVSICLSNSTNAKYMTYRTKIFFFQLKPLSDRKEKTLLSLWFHVLETSTGN